MNQIKLICSDIDGTLIDSSGAIRADDKAALRRAVVDMGIPFAIVSGRFRGGMRPITSQLDFEASISCFNGLYIEMKGKAVHNDITDKAVLLRILPKIRQFGCTPIALSLDNYAMEDDGIWHEAQRKLCGQEGIIINLDEAISREGGEPYYKILAKHTDRNALDALSMSFEQEQELYPGLKAVFSSPNILEFIPKLTDKARAVDFMAEYLGISVENVMAFGDYDNDIGMIRRAGLGICMSNGTPAAKAAADYVTASNEECGIAKALEKFVFRG
ncbi:MAG: Cof-type HAD-IIB family hydrolase [Sphaerochaetaceae bacterium]